MEQANLLARRAQDVHGRLLAFYGEPLWRTPLPAIDELVSTILSQNTTDHNRDLAFNALRSRLPDWESVRDADPAEVVNAIRIAGLANQKGPRIQQVLRQITAERGSLDLEFLRGWQRSEAQAWLSRFKGVGPKTTAIVLQFSLGIPAFPVDTHIYRVSGRLGLRPEKMTVENAHPHLEGLLPPPAYYAAHLNLCNLPFKRYLRLRPTKQRNRSLRGHAVAQF
jgi:endonuclease-3